MCKRSQMKRKIVYTPLLVIAMLACSCGIKGQGYADVRGDEAKSDTLQVRMGELPLPEVPASLTATKERARYIIDHFWDCMDFSDTLISHDRSFMEQNIVNFLSLFPHADEEALPSGIDRFLEHVAKDSVTLGIVADIAERYLNDPNSPMRNESYYILFLESFLRQKKLPEHMQERSAYRLEMARKNRPGMTATDFSYTDRNGKQHTLHTTSATRLLILFYDPACPHCSDILEELRQSRKLAEYVSDNKLTVLAVYTEGDRKLWDETKSSMPKEWTVVIDNSNIVDRELYDLPAMPIIYVLDQDKTVLMKDAAVSEIERFL